MSTELPAPYDHEYDDEIDLKKYLVILWRFRFMLVLAAVTCGLVTYLMSGTTPPIYRATAQVTVTLPKPGETAGPLVSMGSAKAVLNNQTLAAEIVRELALDKPPYALTPFSFLNGTMSSEVLRDTNVIIVTVQLADPELAAKVANRYVELAVGLSQRLGQEDAVGARDRIKMQVEQSAERLAQAERTLEEFKTTAQVELIRTDVNALLTQRGKLVELTVEIEGERARLAKAEQEFSVQPRVRREPSALDVSESLRREAPEASPVRGALLDPFINPVYEMLNEQIAVSRTKLAGLEKRRTELVSVLKLNGTQMDPLVKLYAKEAELARRQAEFDLAKKIYVDVATRYEQARLQASPRTAQLQVLDSALPPAASIAPRPLRLPAIAAVLGFFGAAIGVLILNAIATAMA